MHSRARINGHFDVHKILQYLCRPHPARANCMLRLGTDGPHYSWYEYIGAGVWEAYAAPLEVRIVSRVVRFDCIRERRTANGIVLLYHSCELGGT
jgi:hypothetical protein